jgi:hypothetical protein
MSKLNPFLTFIIIVCLVLVSAIATDNNNNTSNTKRTFSYTFKPGQVLHPKQPLVLCNHTAKNIGQHAVLISWFTGELFWDDFSSTIISYYIDGETKPSIRGTIDLLTGNAPSPKSQRKTIPWGNEALGRLGIGGGAYTSTRIPFKNSIVVTAEMNEGNTFETITSSNMLINQQNDLRSDKSKTFYSLIRGLENYGPITLRYSNIQLDNNVKLKSFFLNETLKPAQWITLLNVSSGKSGCLFSVVQQVRSENAYCLEGTHWARVGNSFVANAPKGNTREIISEEELQLSSGFEDYYLSGQYFDAGEFSTPISGMTSEDHWLYPHSLTAYRYHEVDPIMFTSGMSLRWQNGMNSKGKLAAGITQQVSFILAYVVDDNDDNN